MGNKSVLVIGDVSMDVFFVPRPDEAYCQMKAQEQYICFSYGDKIPVDDLTYCTGGNAANVSIGLRRLDISSSIYTTLGSDCISRLIYEHLQKEQIDTQHVTMQPGATANYATIISFKGERTVFTYHAPKTYTYKKDPITASSVYLTSMGEQFMPFYLGLLQHLAENPGIRLLFNPGSLQTRAAQKDIRFILSRTNTLFVNRKEAEIFTGVNQSTAHEKELLQALAALGPKEIIITDGDHGVYAFDGTEYFHSSVIPVTVIEKTGAGDAFNSAFIAARLHDLSFTESLRWGTMNAASVIGYIGAQKGLLHKKDIDSWTRIAEKSGLSIQTL